MGEASRSGRMERGGQDMIEFREDQLAALDESRQPASMVDPRTGQEYLLIKREVFDKIRLALKPMTIDPADTEDDDLIVRKGR